MNDWEKSAKSVKSVKSEICKSVESVKSHRLAARAQSLCFHTAYLVILKVVNLKLVNFLFYTLSIHLRRVREFFRLMTVCGHSFKSFQILQITLWKTANRLLNFQPPHLFFYFHILLFCSSFHCQLTHCQLTHCQLTHSLCRAFTSNSNLSEWVSEWVSGWVGGFKITR